MHNLQHHAAAVQSSQTPKIKHKDFIHLLSSNAGRVGGKCGPTD